MELVITNSEVQVGTYRASHADFTTDYGSAPLIPRRGTWANIWRAASLARG